MHDCYFDLHELMHDVILTKPILKHLALTKLTALLMGYKGYNRLTNELKARFFQLNNIFNCNEKPRLDLICR